MAYFRKRTRTFRKSEPQTSTKSGPYTKIHCMSQRLMFDKFERANFKYDNSFLKILAQKYPNEAFLVTNLAIFIISRNFAIRPIGGCGFQI